MIAATRAAPVSTQTPPEAAGPSPWGPVQMATNITPGITFVSCSGHGGFWVNSELNATVPAVWRRYAARWRRGWGDQWYEEDCAACAVVASFPEHFPDPHLQRVARDVLGTLSRSDKMDHWGGL